MLSIDSARTFFKYSDWANGQILSAAAKLDDAALDQPFEMGRGSLRLTLMHIHAGEHVWLQRWHGRTETPWPDEDERVAPAALADRFAETRAARDQFLAALKDADLARSIPYRDSKGGLFKATLADMLTQGILHSHHHRAQAVNMLRRAAGVEVELDYMMWVRQPA